MRAGSLRQRLQLQILTGAVDDGMGGKTGGTWTTSATVWGQIDPQHGTERLQAMQMTAEITHAIVIRYRTGITPKMRMVRVAGGQVFEIQAVLNIEARNRQLELLCSEIQTTGA